MRRRTATTAVVHLRNLALPEPAEVNRCRNLITALKLICPTPLLR